MMRTQQWVPKTFALALCLGALGVMACGEADDDSDRVSSQAGDLKKGDKKPDVPAPGDVAAPGGKKDPCKHVECSPDERCELQEVQCIRAPCPPVATCVPKAGDGEPEPASCAATLCLTGTVCVEGPNGAECVAPAGCAATLCETGTVCVEGPSGAECIAPASCAATLCLTGTVCVEGPNGAQCVAPRGGCDDFKCDAGTHCELETVQCLVAPCPELPSCVPDVDKCAAVRCKAGTHCVEQQVQCIQAPCDPIVACVPN